VTLIGLGTRGTALGLALSRPELNLRVVGCDPMGSRQTRQDRGAFTCEHNRNAPAKRGTDLPGRPYSEFALSWSRLPRAQGGCGGIETAPLKGPTFEWAAQGLPGERHLVGAYLLARYPAPEAPTLLYERGLLVVVAPRGTESSALEFTTRLAPAIGASSFFVDPQEFDGLMAGAQGLPLLMALACYRSVAEAPGWNDASRLAGETFAEATQLLASRVPQRAASELAANRENLLRRLDLAQEEIEALRRLLTGDP
jgi:prephenate dehydrogenase